MNKTETLNLIEGTFSEAEARDILIGIYSAKINFHQLKNFSSQERFGKDDETAQKRIPKLKKEIEKLKAILSEAQTKNQKLIINSEITISLAND
jgi:hypothetical protein